MGNKHFNKIFKLSDRQKPGIQVIGSNKDITFD